MLKMKVTKRNKIFIFLLATSIFLAIFILISSAQAQAVGSDNLEEELDQIKAILDTSVGYSTFQRTMILNSARELLENGMSFNDTKNIIENHLKNSINAYSVQKSLILIREAQRDGLPIEPLINKMEEGLAKKVESDKIFSVVNTELKNLQAASNILQQIEYGSEMENYQEIVKKLAYSLGDGLSQDYLSIVVKRGIEENKSVEEIAEVSEELGSLNFQASEMGLSTQVIANIFNSAADSSTLIEEICIKIKDVLRNETAVASMQSSKKDDIGISADSSSGTDTSIPIEGPGPVTAGETPLQDSGTSPIDTDNTSGPSSPSENEDSAAPPEN